jgi:hypothetical protein
VIWSLIEQSLTNRQMIILQCRECFAGDEGLAFRAARYNPPGAVAPDRAIGS